MVAKLTVGICSVFAVLAIHQAACALWFCAHLLRGASKPAPAVTHWPRVAILLALRGADRSLRETLCRLASQDYPHYSVHVVVDNSDDPAWSIVREARDRWEERFFISTLDVRRASCGLQCSAFLQAAAGLDSVVDVVVTVDGDILPHRSLLRELVTPLLDPSTGAAFGNRWFVPDRANAGSLVRHLWNAGAVVPMTAFGIPWGGCMAMRRTAMVQAGLLDKWAHVIVHDAPVHSAMAALGLKTCFVPTLMMPIREGCTLSFCLDFVTRQLLWTRTYHPAWWFILGHALLAFVPLAMTGALLVDGAFREHQPALWTLSVGAASYLAVLSSLAVLIDECVRHVLRRAGEPLPPLDWRARFALPPTVVLTQALHLLAAIRASMMRHVRWRGVRYEIRGPWSVRLLEERTFREPEATKQGFSL